MQARDLYNGRVLNWRALGSDAGEVVLVSREDGSAAAAFFESRAMGDERVSLTAVGDIPGPAPMSSSFTSPATPPPWLCLTRLCGERAADATANPALPVKVLALEGRTPTGEALIEQQYVLTQPLYLITRGNPPGLRQFIDFVLSRRGRPS